MLKKDIVWFSEVDKHSVNLVGGKGANLGEMVNAGLPVPYGFVVTSTAYFDFIHANKLDKKINQIINLINYDNPQDLETASTHIRKLIDESEFPEALAAKIIDYYYYLLDEEDKIIKKHLNLIKKIKNRLKHVYHPPYLAVRSSATAEDLPSASFAGQQETYLNVYGESALIEKVKLCWSSLFTQRAIYYRHQQGFDHKKVGLAVVCQRMVQSDKSGIAFSIDPVTNDKNKIVIEAIFGLGEYIVSGKITPDHYELDKHSLVILKKQLAEQKIMLTRGARGNKEIKLTANYGHSFKLTDEEIIKIGLLVKEIEKHYYFPQDIEWAIEDKQPFIVQSRPITTIPHHQKTNANQPFIVLNQNQPSILTGSPASPGIGFGPVKIIYSPKEINRVESGDILVAPQTNPDYVPAMKKAAAIITEKGGRTSHAAIVSRELGIPAVVGAEGATKKLKDGEVITVNGLTGDIYKGVIKMKESSSKESTAKNHQTKTKIYVNLAEPEEANHVAKLPVDGVGLLRAEFMIANIGTHPKKFIKDHQETNFVHYLTTDLMKFARAFYPRPVIYRATDFKTNEYRHLKGGARYEPNEENPMLGFRGASRYIKNPEVFLLELKAIANIWDKGFHNLHLMIPFVRTGWELIKIKEIINKTGLLSIPDFHLLIMVEIPAVALNLTEFLKIGVSGISIGTNDLTMLMFGVDRDNQEVADVYDERHPTMIKLLCSIVEQCQKFKVTSSICGQAASDYPEVVEPLIKSGITSLSVNPDAVIRTRELVFNLEKKLI